MKGVWSITSLLALVAGAVGVVRAADPIVYDWVSVATPAAPEPFYANCGFVVWNDKLYAFGGTAAGEVRSDRVWAYDLATGTWSLLGASLPYALDATQGGHAVVDGTLIIGPQIGTGGSGSHRKIVEYDLSGAVAGVETADYGYTFWRPLTAAAADTVYSFGGAGSINKVHRYNVATQTLTELAVTVAGGTPEGSALDANGNIWLFGGNLGSPRARAVECFNPTTEQITYSNTTALPSPDLSGGYAMLAWNLVTPDERVMYVGDCTTRKVYRFDPATQTFGEAPELFELPAGVPGSFLASRVADEATGKVYVMTHTGPQTATLWIGTPRLPARLVGHWNFQDGTGSSTLRDQSGNALHGTLRNMEANEDWTMVTDSGRRPTPEYAKNNALHFDGADEYVEIPHSAEMNFGLADFTLSLWFKSSEAPPESTWDALWSKHNNAYYHDLEYWIGIAGSNQGADAGKVFACLGHRPSDGYAEYVYSNAPVLDGAWHMVTMVRREEGGQRYLKLYVDAELQGSRTTILNVDNTNPVTIGRGNYNNGYGYFEGLIDEVRLYRGAVASGAIMGLYGDWLPDADADGDVDLADYAVFQSYFTGPL